ncbi:MAG: hypothetical protein JST04_04000 [Bdellovibrionales bacterium]|nr:hypothetical protein [Bdellovibrionales bacterium]
MKSLLKALLALFVLTANAFAHGGGEAEIEVGPDKGVIEITKDKAFKLAPEAKQTFGLKAIPYTSGPITLPNRAIVHALKESQIFRLRGDYLKIVHFKTVKQTEQSIVIESHELQSGDQVVTDGVGFLRIIAAQVGEEEEADHHD